jgi:3-methyladenine DNA glycosylase AlkD
MEARLAGMAGSTTEELRRVRREYSRQLENAEPRAVVQLAERLLRVPRRDGRFLAYELIHHHRVALSRLNAKQLERLGRGIASWGAVDCFAVYLAGPAWRERQVPNSLIHSWARARDRWWRRAALVSTVPLNSKSRGGTGEPERTLEVCRLLERDRDPMVTKALSWALRELAKRDPRAVREYIVKRKEVLPALVVREVKNKLNTGLKNPKKR